VLRSKHAGLTRHKSNVRTGMVLELDGEWDFREDPEDEGEARGWWKHWPEGGRKITVPYCWQASFPDLRTYSGTAWYHRAFALPESWAGRRVLIHFGAVDYYCDLWVNGAHIGGHEGGYLPFYFDVTERIKFGSGNEVVLRVFDAEPQPELGKINFYEIPHGKQGWYSAVSGIWQSVWLESTGEVFVEDVFTDPDASSGKVDVRICLNKRAYGDVKVEGEVEDEEGEVVAHEEAEVPVGSRVVLMSLEVEDPALWEPENPCLYRLVLKLLIRGEIADERVVPFGFRTVEAADEKVMLNGRPVYIRGALDQDFYPLTIYTPPDEDWIRRKITASKELGLNLLRVHVKVADPRLLEWADRLGILIWEEVPHWERSTVNSKLRAEDTLVGMVLRDYNHPSIVIWGIANEGWGLDLKEGGDRDWLKSMYDTVKSLDRSRLVVDNSACHGNFHVKTDILDYHTYASIPDHSDSFERFCKRFSEEPDFAWGEGSEPRGEEPRLVSEFGNWGLPDFDEIRQLYGGDPYWVATGFEAGVPYGFEARFSEWGLERAFGSLKGFLSAYRRHQLLSLKYETSVLRRHPEISGYVITELCDVNWECNGLLDIFMRHKHDPARIRAMNADVRVDIDPTRVNFWSGDEASVRVWVYNASEADLSGHRLRWELSGAGPSGTIEIPTSSSRRRTISLDLEFRLPEVDAVSDLMLSVRLLAGDLEVSCDELRIWVYPRLRFPRLEKEVVIVERLDVDSLRRVSGARSVFLVEHGEDARLPVASGISVVRRGGDWISNLNFLMPGPHVGEVPLENPLGWEYREVIPQFVFKGVGPEASQDILGGYLEGWVNNVMPHTLLVGVGGGVALLTTLRLRGAYGSDPLATYLLHSFMEYVSEVESRPAIRLL